MKRIYKLTMLLVALAISINLMATDYIVSGAGTAAVNGTYTPDGTNINGAPRWVHTSGTYYLHSDGSFMWVINDDGDMPMMGYYENYSGPFDQNTPPFTGWSTMMGSNPAPTVGLAAPSLSYSSGTFFESSANDGTIDNSQPLIITHNNFGGGAFTGTDGDNFVAGGKVIVTNLPAGLTAVVARTSATTLSVTLTGAATAHDNANDLSNLTFTFQNTAFSTNDASGVSNSTKSDIAINFIQPYSVASSGADFTSIAAAIAAADVGDIINVSGETFTEVELIVDKDLTIRGQGADVTIIQAATAPNIATHGVFKIEYYNVTIENVTIRYGCNDLGGIDCNGHLTLQNSIVCDNSGVGGGIYCQQSGGNLNITNCLINNNTASHSGGGIYCKGNATITNSTITGNTVTGYYGGAIRAMSNCYLTLIYCTITNNTATGDGDGIHVNYTHLTISNTLIAGNGSSDYHVAYSIDPFFDNGNNIIGNQTYEGSPTNWKFSNASNILYNYKADGTAATSWNRNNVVLANQNLGLSTTLADNGTTNGTQTHAINAGSFAIGAGQWDASVTSDQRGLARQNPPTIGAYEYLVAPIYVNAAQANDNGDGLSWATAKKYLQSGLALATTGDEIWVAAGVYYPDEGDGVTNNDQDASFYLIEGVKIYGGFAGTESSLSARNWATNKCILSGDISQDDTNTDGNHIAETSANIVGSNSMHVVYADGTGTASITGATELNGFYITAGSATANIISFSSFYSNVVGAGKESSSTLSNNIIRGSSIGYSANGGGLYCNGDGFGNESSPSITNCSFTGNSSSQFGGAICTNGTNSISSPTITNCSFSGNSAGEKGGGICNLSNASGTSSPSISSCSFSGNSAMYGGAISNSNQSGTCSPSISNCILWGNTATGSDPEVNNSNASPTFSYCDIAGSGGSGGSWVSSFGTDGGNNIDIDPMFVDASTGDLRLLSCSPALDAGNDAANTTTTDLDNNPRLYEAISGGQLVDMGAYEFQGTFAPCCTNPTVGGTIATDQTICSNTVPAAFTSTADPSGHSGTLEYKWQESTTSASSGFADIANSNSATYAPSALTVDTWYKRLARVDCETDWTDAVESNVVAIIIPTVAPPILTIQSNTATTATESTANGTITQACVNATNRGAIWYEYTDTDKEIGDAGVTNVDESGTFGEGTFSATLTSLSPNTQYNVRAHAINPDGTGYSSRTDFRTLANVPGAPTVDGATATSLDVTVNGNGNPASTEFVIMETSTSKFVQADGSLNTSEVWQTAAIWGAKTVTGLTTGVTYTFKVKARNGDNVETVYGGDAQGVPVDVPAVSTQAATLITATTSTGNGTITNTNGANATNRGLIIYPYTDTDKEIGDADVTNVDENGDFGAVAFTASFTGLDVDAQYNVRAHATNQYGTGYGNRVSFWTLANVPAAPTVDGALATSLDVTVNVNGNPASTEFCIMETSTGKFVQADGSLNTTELWQDATTWGAQTVTALTTGTTYTFKVKARNGDNVETTYSGEAQGVPVAVPSVTTQAVSAITTTTATGNGTITNTNGANATNRGLIIYPYTDTDKEIGDADVTNVDENGDFGAVAFTASFTALDVNTQFNVRAHATNQYGIGYGNRVSFWTLANVPDAPTVDGVTATSLDVTVNANANPAITEFCIYETSNAKFVQLNGSLGATEVWQTAAAWGTITLNGLSTGVTYTFKVKARNGENVETAYGPETSATTCLNPDNGGTIDAAQTICYGDTPNALSSISEASGFGGTLEYKWQLSTTDAVSGFSDISSSNSSTYTPGSLTTSTWYKRLARVDCKADWTDAVESNVVAITVNPLPIVSCPVDQELCIDAGITELSTLTAPLGGIFSGTGISGTSFDPLVATSGVHAINYSFTDVNGCTDDCEFDITVSQLASVYAGADASICETGYLLNPTVSYEDIITWTTYGDGTFDDPYIEDAYYTPGPVDLAVGSVILELVATPANNPPCINLTSDQITLTIVEALPTVAIGSDNTICDNESYTFAPAVSNAQSVMWTTFGDGSFDNRFVEVATYTPGSGDIAAGFAHIKLEAAPFTPCVNIVGDDVMIYINESPSITTGSDATICETGSYTISDFTAANYSSLSWTGGDGTFDNAAIMAPTYTPGAGDIAAGSVQLTLSANPIAPCVNPYQASITLSVITTTLSCPANATEARCQDQATIDAAFATWLGTAASSNGYLDAPATNDNTGAPLATGGSTTVTWSISDWCQNGLTCSATFTVDNYIEPAIIFASNATNAPGQFYAGAQLDFCSGQTIDISLDQIVAGDGPFTIEWTENTVPQSAVTVGQGQSLFSGNKPVGTYNIQITSITDSYGCVRSDYTDYNAAIEVHEEPAVIFNENGTPFYAGATMSYCADENIVVSLGNVLSGTGPFVIEWTENTIPQGPVTVSLNDNLFSGTKAAGTYNIQITKIADIYGCEPTDYAPYNASFIVKPMPTITSVDPSDEEVCDGESVSFSASGLLDGLTTFSYTIDDGTPPTYLGTETVTVTGGTHTFAAAPYPVGTYTVTINSIEVDGCISQFGQTVSTTFTVHPLPVVTCPPSQEACIDHQIVDLTFLGATPAGGTFSGTGVIGDDFNPAVAGVGSFTINYSFTDANGCTNDCDFTFTVHDLPVVICPAEFPVCEDLVPFVLSGADPIYGTYAGSGVSGSIFDPSAASIGANTISYSFTDGNGCENSCDFDITVNALPAASISSNAGICLGEDLDLDAMPTGMVSYEWTGPAAWTSNLEMNTITPTATDYVGDPYMLTVTDANGCSGTASLDVLVGDPQLDLSTDPLFTIVNDEVIVMYPVSMNIWANVPNQVSPIYVWDSGATLPYISINDYGTYNVTVTDMGCEATASLTVNEKQDIQLRQGWGLLSTYINTAASFDVLLADLVAANNNIVVKDEDGHAFISYNGAYSNGLPNHTMGEGYQYYMSKPNQVLTIVGEAIDPYTTPLSLDLGYNFIAYLRRTPAPVVQLMAPIASLIDIMKNEDGQVYWYVPSLGIWINQIGDLWPGKGYQLKLLAATTYTYPANPVPFSKSDTYVAQTSYFAAPVSTGNNMTLGIPEKAWSMAVNVGDEVGVFNQNGDLVGSGVYDNDNMAISLWGDNETTKQTNGLANKEVYTLQLWNSLSGLTETLVVTEWVEGNGTYSENDIAIVGKLAVVEESGLSLNNYPNPFKDVTTIEFSIPEDGKVRVELFNSNGKRLQVITDRDYTAGTYELQFNAGKLSVGTYFIKLESNGQTINKAVQVVNL